MCTAHIFSINLKTLVGRSGLSGNLSRWATERVAGGDISSRPSRPTMQGLRSFEADIRIFEDILKEADCCHYLPRIGIGLSDPPGVSYFFVPMERKIRQR